MTKWKKKNKLGPKASMCRELNWVEVGEGDG